MEENTKVNFSTGTIVKILTILVLFVFIYLIRGIMMSVLLSLVIASGVEPVAVWFQKRKIPRVLAVVFVYLFIFVCAGGVLYTVMPTIFSEVSAFVDRMPAYLEKPFSAGTVDSVFENLPSIARDGLGGFVSSLGGYINNITSNFYDYAMTAFGGAVSFVLVIVLSFYFSVQENGVENFLRTVIPVRHEEYAISLWERWRKKIGHWAQGQVVLGLVVGAMVYVGLLVLGVEYALTLAILAAVFELIPVVGPIVAAVPALIISFLVSPILAVKVLVLYVAIQQLENHLIYPLVVRKIIGIPSAVVVLSFVIGASVGGLMGIILSVPLATAAMEVFEDLNTRKKKAKTG